ncbi:unnamed protein product [Macrosiphum euphorbiae]|uniref:Uncharacterized protein n=1 Tax=Macrosiphum euphorbiae TaxID=13131 RepID=A0AAV0XVG4_9HEMI|nr:unnamed protein product [Macrosiphum euphorbiae]
MSSTTWFRLPATFWILGAFPSAAMTVNTEQDHHSYDGYVHYDDACIAKTCGNTQRGNGGYEFVRVRKGKLCT